MVDRNNCSSCNDRQIEKENVKFFHSKENALVEEAERKLGLLCKESRRNIISKL